MTINSLKKMILFSGMAISLLMLVFMSGCAENDQADFEILTGRFVDSPVGGLGYRTETQEGKTDSEGRFNYVYGETISFFIGDIILGTPNVPIPTDENVVMTPKSLVPGAADYTDDSVVLIARFLQTLDTNNNPNDGIDISDTIHEAAVASDDLTPADIVFISDEEHAFTVCEQLATSVIEHLSDTKLIENTEMVLPEDASKHLIDSINLIINPASNESNSNNSKISIERDAMGVWFLTGPFDASLYDIFFEVGYQVAKDRLFQLEKYKRAATGRLSEVLGEDQKETDIFVRTMGYSRQELTDGFNGLDEESKNVIRGYVDGINKRIQYVIYENRSEMPMEYMAIGTQLGIDFVPEQWEYEDLLAWNVLLQRQFDPEALETDHGQLENIQLLQRLSDAYTDVVALPDGSYTTRGALMFKDLRWNNDPKALTYILDNENFDVPSNWTAASRKRQSSNVSVDFSNIPDYSKSIGALQDFRRAVKNNLERINANVKMGSYAWVVSGDKTVDGNPIIYAGPQMGFESPSICIECSIKAGGLEVSGMMIPGIPGVILGRTPHHAWSMQVGHVHSTDFYFDVDPSKATMDRVETIKIAGQEPIIIPVYKIEGRPVISPLPLIAESYSYSPLNPNPLVSWRYSHVGHEFNMVSAMLDLARAQSVDAFGDGIEKLALSQHFCYADKDGNIAYWMSGRDPIRPEDPTDLGYQVPQGSLYEKLGVPPMTWDDDNLKDRSKFVNPVRGYFAGWNNRTHSDYPGTPNNIDYNPGPFHRSHIIYDYLDSKLSDGNKISYDEVKNLALYISTTESIGKAGNPWKYAKNIFTEAVNAMPTNERQEALSLLNNNNWEGHFIEGIDNWVAGMDRSDEWMLMDTWIRNVIKNTFNPYKTLFSKADEGEGSSGAEGDEEANLFFGNEYQRRLFNVILRSFRWFEEDASTKYVQTDFSNYDWFNNVLINPYDIQPSLYNLKESAYAIIVQSLDEALSELGEKPWGTDKRGDIKIYNEVITLLSGTVIDGLSAKIALELCGDPCAITLMQLQYLKSQIENNNYIWSIPFASRSTYAQCVEMGATGPIKIESFFPLGQSGQIYWYLLMAMQSAEGLEDFYMFLKPEVVTFYHKNFFDMSLKYFDSFRHRPFPLF
jgi:penicillin amidase